MTPAPTLKLFSQTHFRPVDLNDIPRLSLSPKVIYLNKQGKVRFPLTLSPQYSSVPSRHFGESQLLEYDLHKGFDSLVLSSSRGHGRRRHEHRRRFPLRLRQTSSGFREGTRQTLSILREVLR